MFAFYCACCFFPTSLCGVLVLVLYPVVRRLLLLRHAPPPTPPCHTQSFTHISLTYISHIQLCHTHNKLCVRDVCFTHTHMSMTYISHTIFHTLDKKWIIEVIRWELNPLTCNWIRNNDLKKISSKWYTMNMKTFSEKRKTDGTYVILASQNDFTLLNRRLRWPESC